MKKIYEKYGGGNNWPYFKGVDSEVKENLDCYLKNCVRSCQKSSSPLRLLDVGCGTGLLLERASKLGLSVEGVEISKPLVQRVKNDFGYKVYEDVLTHLDFSESSFDIVTLYDLIEHLEDPVGNLEKVYKILKNGGILFILTPNENALLRKICRLGYFMSFRHLKEPMELLYYRHHISYFNQKSLFLLLKRTGFEVIDWETKNPELGRLKFPPRYFKGVQIIYKISEHFKSLGGKLVLYARKI